MAAEDFNFADVLDEGAPAQLGRSKSCLEWKEMVGFLWVSMGLGGLLVRIFNGFQVFLRFSVVFRSFLWVFYGFPKVSMGFQSVLRELSRGGLGGLFDFSIVFFGFSRTNVRKV